MFVPFLFHFMHSHKVYPIVTNTYLQLNQMFTVQMLGVILLIICKDPPTIQEDKKLSVLV